MKNIKDFEILSNRDDQSAIDWLDLEIASKTLIRPILILILLLLSLIEKKDILQLPLSGFAIK